MMIQIPSAGLIHPQPCAGTWFFRRLYLFHVQLSILRLFPPVQLDSKMVQIAFVALTTLATASTVLSAPVDVEVREP
jgi:hypothetical protein